MKIILKLVKEKNNKATIKEMKNATKYENALKGDNIYILSLYLLFIVITFKFIVSVCLELNDIRQENKALEEFISENESYRKMVEKIKQENDCLRLVYKKNVSTISRKILSFIFIKIFLTSMINWVTIFTFVGLKDEILNDSKVSFNKSTLQLNLDDDDFLGFDSVTTVTSVFYFFKILYQII